MRSWQHTWPKGTDCAFRSGWPERGYGDEKVTTNSTTMRAAASTTPSYRSTSVNSRSSGTYLDLQGSTPAAVRLSGALPPTEIAIHPPRGCRHPELYLMCDDIVKEVEDLTARRATDITHCVRKHLQRLPLPSGRTRPRVDIHLAQVQQVGRPPDTS